VTWRATGYQPARAAGPRWPAPALELKVNIVKALTLNTPSVAATGQVVSGGRRIVTASGQITGADGTLYAHATTTCLVFEPRPVQEKGPAQEEEPSGRSGRNGHGR
jgi:acyl-coenzyme A thioesterase PaaI-like protein